MTNAYTCAIQSPVKIQTLPSSKKVPSCLFLVKLCPYPSSEKLLFIILLHHRLVLPVLVIYINRLIEYVLFLFRSSFIQHILRLILICICISSLFFLWLLSTSLYDYLTSLSLGCYNKIP